MTRFYAKSTLTYCIQPAETYDRICTDGFLAGRPENKKKLKPMKTKDKNSEVGIRYEVFIKIISSIIGETILH